MLPTHIKTLNMGWNSGESAKYARFQASFPFCQTGSIRKTVQKTNRPRKIQRSHLWSLVIWIDPIKMSDSSSADSWTLILEFVGSWMLDFFSLNVVLPEKYPAGDGMIWLGRSYPEKSTKVSYIRYCEALSTKQWGSALAETHTALEYFHHSTVFTCQTLTAMKATVESS